ncbi:MAG: biotin/lipoyl-binding protein [Acidobacteria bacterium]|nr:biotin/lipoyl-binding protein [Acidobacteriota bacterium]
MKLQIGIDGKNYEIEVEVIEDDAVARHPQHGPYTPIAATIQSSPAPQAKTQPEVSEANVNEAKVCRSPVAGLVIKVNVKPGDVLETNQLIMVLEAMKMETNVTAAVSGKVKSVRVQAGDAVKTNQILAEFE